MIDRNALDTLDLADETTGERLPNIHPGEVLREEFLVPLCLSAYALAKGVGVPVNRITAILNGDRAITAETALLLGERLGTTPEFWLHLQAAYDLEEARLRRAA